MRGYFSLLQYCPDLAKAESANVGVVLLCPEARFFEGKLSSGNDRARRFFGLQGEALDCLVDLKQGFEKRLQLEKGRITKLEEFQQFVDTRANKLLLTLPRNMRVDDPAEDLLRLYRELVGGRAMGDAVRRTGQGVSVRPRLRELFARPELKRRVEEDVCVAPRYGRPFTAPYAFYNGKDSFVVPQVIHTDRDQTLREAEALAFRGTQLANHGIGDRKAELIVPLPALDERFGATTEEVLSMLQHNKVRTVTANRLDEFAQEIEKKADLLSRSA